MRKGNFRPHRHELIVFALVGALATVIQYITFMVLLKTTMLTTVSASCCGYIAGAISNYRLNRNLTFNCDKVHRQALLQFMVVVGFGFSLNAGLMAIATTRLHCNYLLAQIATTGCVFVWNYLAHKYWTFRNGNTPRAMLKK